MKLSREEFDRLSLEHLDMLYRLARRLTRDPTRAEDLVQETYVRALRASENFELNPEYGIRPWLIRILHNVHFSRSERERKQPGAIDDDVLEATARTGDEAVFDSLHNRGGAFNAEMIDQRLAAALDELADEYRSVMVLWAIEDLSYKEIAEACGVPLGTVMSRLHRARQKLAEKLSDFMKQEGMARE